MKKVSAKAAIEKYGSLAKHRAFLGKPPKKGSVVPFPCDAAVVFAKQVAGLVRRLEAVPGRDIAIGLSGGLDSALALLVAVAAYAKLGLDKRGLHVYTMPGFGTTRRTKGNAELLCEGLGVKLETISIVKACRQHFKDIGHDGKTPDVTYENAQARMRTLILMDKANMTGGFVLGTGDLSEIALGWCTYNGDHMAMFAVNNDVPKTVVRKICRWWAGENPGKAADAILDIVATPVSPELVKGQVRKRYRPLRVARLLSLEFHHERNGFARSSERRRTLFRRALREARDSRHAVYLHAPFLHPGFQAQLPVRRSEGVSLRAFAAWMVDSFRAGYRKALIMAYRKQE